VASPRQGVLDSSRIGRRRVGWRRPGGELTLRRKKKGSPGLGKFQFRVTESGVEQETPARTFGRVSRYCPSIRRESVATAGAAMRVPPSLPSARCTALTGGPCSTLRRGDCGELHLLRMGRRVRKPVKRKYCSRLFQVSFSAPRPEAASSEAGGCEVPSRKIDLA